jgi:UDP-N-acetyl-D-mannosaminuronic acid dehydrogenase
MVKTGGETAPGQTIAIVGGCGHVGLPLGLALAELGREVTLVDTSESRVRSVLEGRLPFLEEGAEPVLARVLAAKKLHATTTYEGLAAHDIVIATIGTPVDEYQDPMVRSFDRFVVDLLKHMRAGQLLLLRSTVFPGVTDRLARIIATERPGVDLAYCPERVAQGYSLKEMRTLPQLISGTSERAVARARVLFGELCDELIELPPVEAELAKLFSNAHRYINFAISNQFYMIAERFGADFTRIHHAATHEYPRLKGFAKAGFAAGPCLHKDTMQLAAFNHSSFPLGQAAVVINEGLPSFLVDQLKRTRTLSRETVGILGMAFKGNNDDARSSLSYKLRKVLALEAKEVLCTDPFIHDADFLPLDEVLARSDVLVIGATHSVYKRLPTTKPVVDVFGFVERSAS